MADHGSTATVTGGRAGQPGAGSWTPRLWGILFVLGGALCLDALDVSMVGVALPSIRTALGLSTASLQWIVSGYVLGYGGLPAPHLLECLKHREADVLRFLTDTAIPPTSNQADYAEFGVMRTRRWMPWHAGEAGLARPA